MKFGDRLTMYRGEKGFNQKEFASALGITPTRLNYWEKNKREPDVEMLKKIASILEVSTDDLIGLQRNEEPQSKEELGDEFTEMNYKFRKASASKKKFILQILEMPDELFDGLVAYLQSDVK
nr:MAG TPA: helix-turn-helix domain protein [Caudoviricetes sp.]